MQVKNNSQTRASWVGGVLIAPGATATVPDAAEPDLKGEKHLELIGGTAIEEDKSLTKAELQAALTDAGIDYPSAANKAELQALFDGAK